MLAGNQCKICTYCHVGNYRGILGSSGVLERGQLHAQGGASGPGEGGSKCSAEFALFIRAMHGEPIGALSRIACHVAWPVSWPVEAV